MQPQTKDELTSIRRALDLLGQKEVSACARTLTQRRAEIVRSQCGISQFAEIVVRLCDRIETRNNPYGMDSHTVHHSTQWTPKGLFLSLQTGGLPNFRTEFLQAEVLFQAYDTDSLEMRDVLADYFSEDAFKLMDELSSNFYWMLRIAIPALNVRIKTSQANTAITVEEVRSGLAMVFPLRPAVKLADPVSTWPDLEKAVMAITGELLLSHSISTGVRQLVINPIITELYGKQLVSPTAPTQS